jgi:hypothetical protein
MIVVGSRYEDAEVFPVVTRRRFNSTLSVMRPVDALSDQDIPTRRYNWRAGDRLDLLGAREYGDPSNWWRVLDANGSVLNPLDLRPGIRLDLP